MMDTPWQSIGRWLKKLFIRLPPTVGVDIESVEVEAEGEKVVAHVWDCGGQGSYYAGHQLFMSYHTAAVMVWKLGMEDRRRYVAQWVDNIRCERERTREVEGEESKNMMVVMLVGTHLDEARARGMEVAAEMEEVRREFIEEWVKSERAGGEVRDGAEADAEEEEGSSVTRELLLQGVYAVDGIDKKAVKYEEGSSLRRVKMREEMARAVVRVCRGAASTAEEEEEATATSRVVSVSERWREGGGLKSGEVPLSYVSLGSHLSRKVKEAKQSVMTVEELWEEVSAMGGRLGFHTQREMEYALEFLRQQGTVVWFREIKRIERHVFVFADWVKDVAMMPLSMYHYVHQDRAVEESISDVDGEASTGGVL